MCCVRGGGFGAAVVMEGDAGATVVFRGGGAGSGGGDIGGGDIGGGDIGEIVVLGGAGAATGGDTWAVTDGGGCVCGRTGTGSWGLGAKALG
jgi:hypothetical protein